MFPYDPELRAAVERQPKSIADVRATMAAIEAMSADGDGLKWFNWLYMEITRAVAQRIDEGGFRDPGWLTELDVHFARLYFDSVASWLAGKGTKGCWRVLLERRNQGLIARVQFALAGINAHINHDLALALVTTCKSRRTTPDHDSVQYQDHCAVNSILSGFVDTAKEKLMLRLLGDALPEISHLEDTIATWNVAAAREAAWVNAEILWRLRRTTLLTARYMDRIDGITSVAGKALLVPVPELTALTTA
jgi:hypothetical protein